MRLTVLAFLAVATLWGQCLLFPVPLAERVAESELIVEAEVVGHRVSRAPRSGLLLTLWELQPTKLFWGELPAGRLTLVQEGGILGEEALVVVPSAPLADGMIGLFFLKPATGMRAVQPGVYELVAGPQGLIVYELLEDRGYDPFARYTLLELYRQLEMLTQKTYRQLRALPSIPQRKAMTGIPMATITSFSPTTISAGTFDTLRIIGSGFGSLPGSVRFRNPDDGGSSWVSVPSDHIFFWSDGEIRVLVPTQAGTGQFQVLTAANETVTSPGTLIIPYALLTVSSGGVRYPVRLVNDNGNGGYTLIPNASFAATTGALEAFQRALQSWRCSTYVNLNLEQTTTSIGCPSNDGTHVVSFDSPSCSLPSGVLGATYNYYAACSYGGRQYWRRGGVDLIFRRPGSITWNFGPQPPGSMQYDFESVALHELGHAHLLGHIIAPGQVMHYAIGPGMSLRTLGSSTDVAGGQRVMQLSTVSAPCGPGAMVPLTAGTCALGRPTANFGATPREGCAPLTVSFTDSSTGAPTTWAWDVNGDGVTDYTTRTCVHTYTQPGQYTVRLIVSNAYGSDTVVRPNYILVFPVPVASAGSDRMVCPGESVRLGGSPTASGGTPPYQYRWEPGIDLDDSTAANPTVRLRQSRTYVLTVTDSRGCQARDTVTLLLRLAPEPRLSILGQTQFCNGDSVRLVAPWGYQRYRWNTGDTVRILTVRRSGSYWCAVQDTASCWGVSDTVTVTVFPLPDARIVGASTACVGDTVLYRAAAPQPGDTFEWGVTGGVLLRGQGMPETWVRWTHPGTGEVRLRQQSQEGCRAESAPLSVSIAPLPQPTITVVGPREFCEGDSTVLEAPEGYLHYRWTTGDTTRRILVRRSGVYTVEVVSAAGCRGSSQPVAIRVYPLPPKPAIERRGDTLLCTVEAAAYRWYYNGQPIIGATGRNFVARLSGTYAVEVVDSNGCRNVSDPLDVTVGVSESLAQLSPCTPNPTEEMLWVELPVALPQSSRLFLSDVLGRTVVIQEVQPGDRAVALPLHGLAAGFYVLRLEGQPRWQCYVLKR